jgi:hypothetical protein
MLKVIRALATAARETNISPKNKMLSSAARVGAHEHKTPANAGVLCIAKLGLCPHFLDPRQFPAALIDVRLLPH